MSKNKEKEHSKITWFVEVFIITFALSICFSYISTYGVSNLNLVSSIIGVAIFIVAIYGGYFLVTYICSKNIIKEK